VVALSVNVSGLVRRPRIIAEWGPVQDEPHWYEGLAIVVTARRRPVEVDEVGIVLLQKKTRRRQAPEWLHAERPFRLPLGSKNLPKRLQDGESVRVFAELNSTIDDLHGNDGVAYTYVSASGTVYLAADSKLRKRLQRPH